MLFEHDRQGRIALPGFCPASRDLQRRGVIEASRPQGFWKILLTFKVMAGSRFQLTVDAFIGRQQPEVPLHLSLTASAHS